MNKEFWAGKRVLITGGASFIGSHIADRLLETGAAVFVVDDLSSGLRSNLQMSHLMLCLMKYDLRDSRLAQQAFEIAKPHYVFHLAANHGGRGYIENNPVAIADNFIIDGNVFAAAANTVPQVEKVIFASSGCVYPLAYQDCMLSEEMTLGPADPDELYGWAKLTGEQVLQAYVNAGKFKGAICRYFTAYGPRAKENHAVMAMIARAFIQQDPFIIWGDGEQTRNWTYVDDIVEGTIRAAEKIEDGSPVNLGTSDQISVIDAAQQICATVPGFKPKFEFHENMPVGPTSRTCCYSMARVVLNWCPRVSFAEGLRRTIDWYTSTHDPALVELALEEACWNR